jgi:hypothetical protein
MQALIEHCASSIAAVTGLRVPVPRGVHRFRTDAVFGALVTSLPSTAALRKVVDGN